jgi:hypothetical protein
VAEKTAACFGSIWVMIVVSQAYIYPLVIRTLELKAAGMPLEQRIREYPVVCMDMLFPLLLEQLLTWYVIWECVLNVLAELTRFADRGFYGDWWNSVSWDQYARDWNRPVHNFLLRHVYHSSISALHLSRGSATLVTFLLSALVHELVMWCVLLPSYLSNPKAVTNTPPGCSSKRFAATSFACSSCSCRSSASAGPSCSRARSCSATLSFGSASFWGRA